MVKINSKFEEALISFMGAKELDKKTKDKYLEFYHKYCNIYTELNTKNIDQFLLYNRSSPPRAMFQNLLKAICRWDFPKELKAEILEIDIPKKTGKKKQTLPRYVTREEIKILEEGIGDKNPLIDGRTKLMMQVQFWGALRLEELMNISLSDLLIEKYDSNKKFNQIRIRSESAKFKKERVAYIPTDVYKKLVEWLKIRMKALTEIGKELKEEEPIWGIKASRYKRLMYDWTLKLLGRRYNSHAFRHGRGTDLSRVEGWDIEHIKEYLGHTSINSTQIYVHISEEDIKNKLEM